MAYAILPDGARIAYDVNDFTDPWREPETILLVHGFSKNRKFWYEWIPALARRYRVIALDQRGHGASSVPSPDFTMALEPFVADLAAFLDALGLASVHLVAAEYTSKIGLEFAIAHPDRLRSLILPGLALGGASSPDTRPWATLCREQGSEAWARATSRMRLPADADPAMREWYVREQARTPNWFLAALFDGPTLDQTDRLPLVVAPTLLMAGGESRQVDPAIMRRAAALMPRCTLVEFPGMPFNVMSACPQDCVTATLNFLDALG